MSGLRLLIRSVQVCGNVRYAAMKTFSVLAGSAPPKTTLAAQPTSWGAANSTRRGARLLRFLREDRPQELDTVRALAGRIPRRPRCGVHPGSAIARAADARGGRRREGRRPRDPGGGGAHRARAVARAAAAGGRRAAWPPRRRDSGRPDRLGRPPLCGETPRAARRVGA